VFNVKGLTCQGCCSKIEAAVAALEMEGVSGCTVILDENRAIVTVTRDVDTGALQQAIVSAGFQAELAAPTKS
jgi:copper chaperone CopZ